MTELEKLKEYLDNNGYVSEWNSIFGERDQIIVYVLYNGTIDPKYFTSNWDYVVRDDKYYIRSWDAVCHKGSYGGNDGLIEIYGSICDDVIGWLTAAGVIKILEDKKNG